MGTSLKVYPFSSIPDVMKKNSWKVVLNYDKVGQYDYDLLSSNSLFIQGKTDDLVFKLIQDIGLEYDFRKFIYETYGDKDIILTEEKMLSV